METVNSGTGQEASKRSVGWFASLKKQWRRLLLILRPEALGMVRVGLVTGKAGVKGVEDMWLRVDLWSTRGRGRRVEIPVEGFRSIHAAGLGLLGFVIDPALAGGKFWDLKEGEQMVPTQDDREVRHAKR